MTDWAARFLEHARKKRKVDTGEDESDEDSRSECADDGGILTEAILDRTFKDLTDAARCARIAGPRDMVHFAVKVRGCEKNKVVAGDRLDYARGGFIGAEVELWCEVHCPTKTKDFSLKKCGEVAAGKLAAEWCRKMEWFYNLWLQCESWEAAGGARALDNYRETEAYANWLDALPPSEARTKGLEIRKMRLNI